MWSTLDGALSLQNPTLVNYINTNKFAIKSSLASVYLHFITNIHMGVYLDALL